MQRRVMALLLIAGAIISLSYPSLAEAGYWVNPCDLIGDPMIARLQQGRKELTPQEEAEIARYGYTGLEIMTYVDANKNPGKDWETYERLLIIGGRGNILDWLWLKKNKYRYRNYRDLLNYDYIRPGGIESKMLGIFLSPPKWRYYGWIIYDYLRAKNGFAKQQEEWDYDQDLRRNRRFVSKSRERSYAGGVLTYDDESWREPWEEEHRILGEDTIRGLPCLVVESKSCIDDHYYLQKRVSWLERDNFLDLHEEQFNRKGILQKVFDTVWEQVEPGKYWVRAQRDYYDLGTKARTIIQTFGWIFDQGLQDGEFLPGVMQREHIWREPDLPPDPINHSRQLPPPPQVRMTFWTKLKIKPALPD